MTPKTHMILRATLVMLSVISIPLTSIACKVMSYVVSNVHFAFYGGAPMPLLTQIWTNKISQSHFFTLLGIVVACLLVGVANKLFKLPDSSPSKTTGLLWIVFIALGISITLIGITVVAALLPALTTTFSLNHE